MDSAERLFNRQRTVHQILGGGLVGDVVLWRRKNLSAAILVVTLAAWLVFEKSGYTLLSLISSVLLLLLTILFLWAKSAAIVNRPAPPLPHLRISEEMVNDAVVFICDHINNLLSVSENIALGRDSRMFAKVAAFLLLTSVVGSFADFPSLLYASLVLVLTVPAIYERFEDEIDRYTLCSYKTLVMLFDRFDKDYYISKVSGLSLEKKKVS